MTEKYTIIEYPGGQAELLHEYFNGIFYEEEILALRKGENWTLQDGRNRDLLHQVEEGCLDAEIIPKHREITKEEVAMILFEKQEEI